ncbi:MAG: RHS repeat protein [Deltaproteobacteria bacterium]|nr:RHS repeat protein [Deltaproteobacteria bacterium]
MKKYLILLSFLILNATHVFGGSVNPETGGYTLALQDFKIEDTVYDLELNRTYNSLSLHKSLFGFKWRSTLRPSFEVMPNGYIQIVDGHGFHTVFKPKTISSQSKIDLARNVFNKLEESEKTEAVKKKLETDEKFLETKMNEVVIAEIVRKFPKAKQVQMKSLIEKNSFLRERWAQSFNVHLFKYSEGSVFETHDRGPELLEYKRFQVQEKNILKNELGYVRTYLLTGKKEFYDRYHRIVRSLDPSGNFLEYEYVDNSENKYQLKQIKNKSGQYIRFTYNKKGFVVQAQSSKGDIRTYQYNDKDLLMEVLNQKGGKEIYKYGKNSLLESVQRSDKEELLSYYPDNRVKTYGLKGTTLTTHYAYEPETYASHSLHNKTSIKRVYETTKDKSFSSVVSTERWYGLRDNHTRFLKKEKIERGNESTETEYSECCGKPLKIIETVKDPSGRTPTSIRKASFTYDVQGRLTEKVEPNGQVVKREYYEGALSHKIKRVLRGNLDLNFEYNKEGDVKKAIKKEKLGDATEVTTVFIDYDNRGRVKTMTDKNPKGEVRIVTFEHNRSGNPITIGIKGLGTIHVKYNSEGKIVDIQSQKGQEVAVQVTEAFNKLLNILEPAGVNLSL